MILIPSIHYLNDDFDRNFIKVLLNIFQKKIDRVPIHFVLMQGNSLQLPLTTWTLPSYLLVTTLDQCSEAGIRGAI